MVLAAVAYELKGGVRFSRELNASRWYHILNNHLDTT